MREIKVIIRFPFQVIFSLIIILALPAITIMNIAMNRHKDTLNEFKEIMKSVWGPTK